MSVRMVLVLLVLGVGFPCGAPAQVLELSEEEALRRVAPDAALIARDRAPAEAAPDLTTAGWLANPRLTFGRVPIGGTNETFAFVSEALPVTGRRALEVLAAGRHRDAVRLRTEGAGQRMRADVRTAFASLLEAQTRADVIAAALKKLRELASGLATREETGQAAGFDRLRAEREVAEFEAAAADAAEARARAQAGLARFVGGDLDPRTVRATASSPSSAALPAGDALVARALATRELQALERDAEAARFARRAAGLSAIPEPELSAGFGRSNAAPRERRSLWSLGLTIPLFDRGGAARARALARERQLDAELSARRRATRASVLALAGVVAERRAAVERFRTTVERSDALERIASIAYENGVRGVLELLDAYRGGAAARLRLASLEFSLRRTEIELEELTGEPLK